MSGTRSVGSAKPLTVRSVSIPKRSRTLKSTVGSASISIPPSAIVALPAAAPRRAPAGMCRKCRPDARRAPAQAPRTGLTGAAVQRERSDVARTEAMPMAGLTRERRGLQEQADARARRSRCWSSPTGHGAAGRGRDGAGGPEGWRATTDSVAEAAARLDLLPGPDHLGEPRLVVAAAAVHVGVQVLDQRLVLLADLGLGLAVLRVEDLERPPLGRRQPALRPRGRAARRRGSASPCRRAAPSGRRSRSAARRGPRRAAGCRRGCAASPNGRVGRPQTRSAANCRSRSSSE